MGIECAKAGGRERWGRTAHNSMWRRFESYLEMLAVLLLAWIICCYVPAACRWLAVTSIPPDLCTIHTAYDPLFCGLTSSPSLANFSGRKLVRQRPIRPRRRQRRRGWPGVGRHLRRQLRGVSCFVSAGRTGGGLHTNFAAVTVFGTGGEGCTHILSYLAHGIRPSPVGVLSHPEGRPLSPLTATKE